jgi:hypothetical protein
MEAPDMRVLMWGSRSLSWRHLPVFRALALHATLALEFAGEPGGVPPMSMDLLRLLIGGGDDEWPRHGDSLILLNGDGPPGRSTETPGAIGADHLALLACMEEWPKEKRSVRWFQPERLQAEQPGLSWGAAAARRDVAMAEAKPERAYCVHTNLEASKGSIITAQALHRLGIGFWYVRVTPAGAVFSIERREP